LQLANVVGSSAAVLNYLKRKPDFDVGRNTTTKPHVKRVTEHCTNSFHQLEALKIPTDGRTRILSTILKPVQNQAEENVTDQYFSFFKLLFSHSSRFPVTEVMGN
jgi:hypothetical protein